MKNEKLDQEYSFDLRPASMEDAGLFYSNDEQDVALGTVGHLRLDFGHGFLELRSTGYPHNDEQFDTLEFKMLLREFLAAMQENGPLESLSSTRVSSTCPIPPPPNTRECPLQSGLPSSAPSPPSAATQGPSRRRLA